MPVERRFECAMPPLSPTLSDPWRHGHVLFLLVPGGQVVGALRLGWRRPQGQPAKHTVTRVPRRLRTSATVIVLH